MIPRHHAPRRRRRAKYGGINPASGTRNLLKQVEEAAALYAVRPSTIAISSAVRP